MSVQSSKTGICKWCNEMVQAELWKKISINGAITFVRICPVCHRFAPFGGNIFIGKADIYRYFTQEQVDKFPILLPESPNHCCVCGAKDVENHHWAPRAIFKEEAESWPQAWLCRQCHTKWHKMVTPQLTWS